MGWSRIGRGQSHKRRTGHEAQKYTTNKEQEKRAKYAGTKEGWPREAKDYRCRFDLVVFAESERITFFEVEHEGVCTDDGPNKETQEQWIKYARVAEATGIPLHIVVPEGKKEETKSFLIKCLKNRDLTDESVLDRVWGFK